MDINAIWSKLTADKVLSESDIAELEKAGMKRAEAIAKAQNEELTYRISGNKAEADGIGDMVHISAQFGGKKVCAEVPINSEGRIDPKTDESKAALEKAGFVSAGVVDNKFVGIKPDGSYEVLQDYSDLAQDFADENKKVQQAKDLLASKSLESGMRDAALFFAVSGLGISNPVAIIKAFGTFATVATPFMVSGCSDPFEDRSTNTQLLPGYPGEIETAESRIASHLFFIEETMGRKNLSKAINNLYVNLSKDNYKDSLTVLNKMLGALDLILYSLPKEKIQESADEFFITILKSGLENNDNAPKSYNILETLANGLVDIKEEADRTKLIEYITNITKFDSSEEIDLTDIEKKIADYIKVLQS